MRKVTKIIKRAFENNEYTTCGNSAVIANGVYLHGNKIISKLNDERDAVELTLAGWNTPTTRERLNGIIEEACFTQKDFEPRFYHHEINEKDYIIIYTGRDGLRKYVIESYLVKDGIGNSFFNTGRAIVAKGSIHEAQGAFYGKAVANV